MKHYQDHELEFKRKDGLDEKSDYPDIRGIILYVYGGDLEECVEKARKQYNLGDNWKLIRCERASV